MDDNLHVNPKAQDAGTDLLQVRTDGRKSSPQAAKTGVAPTNWNGSHLFRREDSGWQWQSAGQQPCSKDKAGQSHRSQWPHSVATSDTSTGSLWTHSRRTRAKLDYLSTRFTLGAAHKTSRSALEAKSDTGRRRHVPDTLCVDECREVGMASRLTLPSITAVLEFSHVGSQDRLVQSPFFPLHPFPISLSQLPHTMRGVVYQSSTLLLALSTVLSTLGPVLGAVHQPRVLDASRPFTCPVKNNADDTLLQERIWSTGIRCHYGMFFNLFIDCYYNSEVRPFTSYSSTIRNADLRQCGPDGKLATWELRSDMPNASSL
ncbi:hypothetical protein NMY22_g15206 [Coprinellus aureogranulatus]|nr:hypothetical protein NMY22_g15206 [Coprinellus aureogranulatus]